MKPFILAAACALVFAGSADADDADDAVDKGVTLEIETKKLVTQHRGMPTAFNQDSVPEVWKHAVRVQGEKLSMDVPSERDPTGKQSTVIFDGKLLTVLDHGRREYAELSKAEIQRMTGADEASRKKLRDEIAKLPADTPPAVRRRMEEQLESLEARSRSTPKRKGEDAKRNPYTYKDEGRTKIERKSLIKWGVYDGRRLIKHLYVAPLSDAGTAARAYPAFKAYATFLAELRDMMPKNLPEPPPSLADDILEVNGLPFITFIYGQNGKVSEEIRVKRAEAATHADSIFVTPFRYRARPSFRR